VQHLIFEILVADDVNSQWMRPVVFTLLCLVSMCITVKLIKLVLVFFVPVLIIIHMNVLFLLKILYVQIFKNCIDFTIICHAKYVLICGYVHIYMEEAMDAAMHGLHMPDLKTT
jgi:hypothetical protein